MNITKDDLDTLARIEQVHARKAIDYSTAVINAGMAKTQRKFTEVLRKVRLLLDDKNKTCAGCEEENNPCDDCGYCVRNPDLTDNFSWRRETE